MVTAALLTGLVVLLFLGSGRSALIVATSIPLSILCSILALAWFGQTINVMTLGGLALAVGILVDDATVMIENIDVHLESGLELKAAIIEAANQIVIPTFVSTLCICIVWLPLFQLSGVAGYLLLPMAEAIIFAMLASFILSRTSGINQAYSASATIGPQDCDVTIGLNDESSPVDAYRAILRDKLPKLFPGTTFAFPAGDITAKILNFGLPAPLDVQIVGRDIAANMAYAQRVVAELRRIPRAWRTRRSDRRWRSRLC